MLCICSCSNCFGETWEGKRCWRCHIESGSNGPNSWEGMVYGSHILICLMVAHSFLSFSHQSFHKSSSIEETRCLEFNCQVSEERLISLLEQINNQTTKQTKVTVSFNSWRPSFVSISMISDSDLALCCFPFSRFRGVGVFSKMMIDLNLCVTVEDLAVYWNIMHLLLGCEIFYSSFVNLDIRDML